jgi:hypothetical protein
LRISRKSAKLYTVKKLVNVVLLCTAGKGIAVEAIFQDEAEADMGTEGIPFAGAGIYKRTVGFA